MPFQIPGTVSCKLHQRSHKLFWLPYVARSVCLSVLVSSNLLSRDLKTFAEKEPNGPFVRLSSAGMRALLVKGYISSEIADGGKVAG